jgi:hypothetical protein
MVFVTESRIIILNSSVVGSYIGVYSNYLELSRESVISSMGMGCRANYGDGCGFEDWIVGLSMQCGGTGASHGGMGGPSSSINPNYLLTCLQMRSR